MSRPNPNNFNGLFEKTGTSTCQIIFGEKHYIPDENTLINLYGSNDLTYTATNLTTNIPSLLHSGACLASGIDSQFLYLITNRRKYRVESHDVMVQYNFLGRIHPVPDIILESIPSGKDITLGGGPKPLD
ncbi:hypothetical protein F9817_16680 [Vibrio sp. CAIM 722]|uniref:Uncharacterized protein n=1 Tax=Vibrio eleionomae TaxID=2653505 RepID=A0A7X4LMT2_9VIBR|nr:hypothetical protein [Vibrio eleionomae]MZI94814.1 hypothetical protein [Vibrio eleionomae]